VSCTRITEESDETETDSGLWEGLEPIKAISTQAFFTARGDLYFALEPKIKEMIDKGEK